jgi:FkbM family methyltransferase
MLLQRLLQSFAPRSAQRASPGRPSKREPVHLTGSNWLVHGRHGIYLADDNDLFIGRALIHYGEYSELEWMLLERYCRSGDTVVEVGANIGAHTVSLAAAVGARGRVIAIEPQPVIFQRLCANVALNGSLHVETLNCGCGAVAATMGLPRIDYGAEGNFGGIPLQPLGYPQPAIEIRVVQLDELLQDASRVDLIKIDVEGMELEVLEGAASSIARHRPVLYVENGSLDRSRQLIERLWSYGYELWWHSPTVYNPDNFFGVERNLYARIASPNMLGVHRGSDAERPQTLAPVNDAAFHPFRKQPKEAAHSSAPG